MMQQHFTRSRLQEEGSHKAAGVLPLALEGTGPVLVLLGAEPCRTGPGGRVRAAAAPAPPPCCTSWVTRFVSLVALAHFVAQSTSDVGSTNIAHMTRGAVLLAAAVAHDVA